MKTRLIVIALVLALAVSTAAAKNKDSDAAIGEKLERQMFDWIVKPDWTSVAAHISPSFQSVHRDGARDRAAELEFVKTFHLTKTPMLSDFRVTRFGNLLIVTYKAQTDEIIGGKPQAGKAVARMSVWQKTPQGWMWLAHANINP